MPDMGKPHICICPDPWIDGKIHMDECPAREKPALSREENLYRLRDVNLSIKRELQDNA